MTAPLLQPQNLGATIDAYRNLYDQRAELNRQVKQIEADMKLLEGDLLRDMDALGIDSARGKTASLRINENVYPSVQDWDQVYEFVKSNDAWYLLERRMTTLAYRQMQEAGEDIPGVEPMTKRTVSTTAL